MVDDSLQQAQNYHLWSSVKMFRKDPQIKALSNLKSSERRRMLGSIIETYSLPDGMAKETEEAILPSIVKQTTFKTAKGVSGTIFTDDGQTPVWFKFRDSELIPTVYTAWKAPFILPIVHTHPPVIGVLEGGADLMWPGTVPPFDERIKEGAIVGIADTKDTHLIKAIGRTDYNMGLYNKTTGMTGIAVHVYHSSGDMLFQLGKQKIKPPKELDIEIKFKELEIHDNELPEELSAKEGSNKPQVEQTLEQPQEVEDDSEEAVKLTAEDIDHFFKRSLFQTLTQETKLELPLNASSFMNHVVSNLSTDHPSIQIKKTSWKKSAKFLKAMEKEGFLKLKGKGDDITVVSSATKENNDQLKNFVPYKVKKSKLGANKENTTKKGLLLVKYYKPTSSIRQIFNELELNYLTFYNANEVKDILNSYIDKHDLVNQRNKKEIILDDTLKSFIKGNDNTLGREKILPLFLAKFSEFHKFVSPSDEQQDNSPPVRGSPPKVEMITETKIGRKVITRVSNFEPFGIGAEEFSNELKVKCSGSSTIGANVQNPKLVEVTVQGPHSKIVIDLLTNKYGLNPNWINFTDKTKPKKKRS